MKKFKGYDEAKPFAENERLPIDGYVIKVLDAKEERLSYGDVLVLSFDIAEGQYKDFYASQYKNQQQEDKKWKGVRRINIPKEDGTKEDDITIRSFKTMMSKFEDSNPKFHWDWDEKKLKGLEIGMVYRDKEYSFNGRTGFWSEPFRFETVETIKEKRFKIPAPKLIDNKAEAMEDFSPIEISDAELPF